QLCRYSGTLRSLHMEPRRAHMGRLAGARQRVRGAPVASARCMVLHREGSAYDPVAGAVAGRAVTAPAGARICWSQDAARDAVRDGRAALLRLLGARARASRSDASTLRP